MAEVRVNPKENTFGQSGKVARRGGNDIWSKGGGNKGGNGHEKGGKNCGSCCAKGHIASVCSPDESNENIWEEVHEHDDEPNAWCILEESEKEQWQEVISKQNRKIVKKEVRT